MENSNSEGEKPSADKIYENTQGHILSAISLLCEIVESFGRTAIGAKIIKMELEKINHQLLLLADIEVEMDLEEFIVSTKKHERRD